ncbi:MAG: sel1 repeat family protein [Synergistaceae bacterium]|nr:sel1 repeat family protein [Synergistaceae bacterium]
MKEKFFAVILVIMMIGSIAFAAENIDSLRIKAEHGDSEAMNKIGTIYHNGEGVKRDYNEAIKWYKMAADLGWMYQNGQGVEKNMTQALKFYKRGAEGGILRSLNQIGKRLWRAQ